MTTFYSEHFSAAVGQTGHFTTLSAPVPLVPVGIKHARNRRTAALMTVPSGQDLASGDIIRLLDLKSSDRLVKLYASMDANWGATTDFDIGLYLKGADNAGAVVDADLFAAAVDWSGEIARVDQFAVGDLDDWDRGKQMWELVNAVTSSTYSVDPGVVFTVALTASSNNDAAADAVEMLIEAYYIAGD